MTYHSGRTLAGASGTFQFDLGIFDEAHKTAGAEGKPNQYLLYQKNIKIKIIFFIIATQIMILNQEYLPKIEQIQ